MEWRPGEAPYFFFRSGVKCFKRRGRAAARCDGAGLFRQIPALLHVDDEHVGDAEFVTNIPGGRHRADLVGADLDNLH